MVKKKNRRTIVMWSFNNILFEHIFFSLCQLLFLYYLFQISEEERKPKTCFSAQILFVLYLSAADKEIGDVLSPHQMVRFKLG